MKLNNFIKIALLFAFLLAGRAGLAQVDLAKNLSGRILLQVETQGQAWYINPSNLKRYYLGRPTDAFNLMRQMGLGIKESDINKIQIGYLNSPSDPGLPAATDEVKQILDGAAASIRLNKNSTAATYFTPEIKELVEYTMAVLGSDGRLSLGNMMSATKLESSTDNEKIYSTEVYVGIVGRKVKVNFYLKKQSDGNWLIANL